MMWAVVWVVFVSLAVAGELFGRWFTVAGAVWFVIFEWWAIRRDAKGDTFSEAVWSAYGGREARIPLVLALVALLGMGLLELLLLVDLRFWPAVAMTSGVAGWLAIHFVFRGKYG